MSDDQVHTFLARERAEAQQREADQRRRADLLGRRRRLGEALRPLLELLPLSGPAATRIPYDDDFRHALRAAFLKVGAAIQVEGFADTVTEVATAPTAHGYALRLLQAAAATDGDRIAGSLEELATLPERSRQDVWDEQRNWAEQLLSGWLEQRLAMQRATATARSVASQPEEPTSIDELDNWPTDRDAGRGAPPGRRRGRRVDTDAKADERIFDAWESGPYTHYRDLARARSLTERQVALAIDRHRKRLERGRRGADK